METVKLNGKLRQKKNLGILRKNDGVPGVVYGLKKDPLTIEVSAHELSQMLAHHNRNSSIELQLGDTIEHVLIQDLTWDPVKDSRMLHVDFIRVDDKHDVTVKVQVTTSGVSVGVKTGGGQFGVMKRFVRIKCKPNEIPEVFNIDVSDMEMGTIFYARDIQLGNRKLVTPAKTALFGVTKGRKEEVPVATKPAEGVTTPAPQAAAVSAPT